MSEFELLIIDLDLIIIVTLTYCISATSVDVTQKTVEKVKNFNAQICDKVFVLSLIIVSGIIAYSIYFDRHP